MIRLKKLRMKKALNALEAQKMMFYNDLLMQQKNLKQNI